MDFSKEGNSLRVDDNLMLFKEKRDTGEFSRQNKYPKALLKSSLKRTSLAPQCTGISKSKISLNVVKTGMSKTIYSTL